MGFRTRPPAVVDGPISAGTLDLPQACARAALASRRPFKFTLNRAAHAGWRRPWSNRHYKSVPDLAMALADAWPSRSVISTPRSCRSTKPILPGIPDEWEWAAAAMKPRA